MKSVNPAQFQNCEKHEGESKTIAEVADEFKVSKRTLRFYEQMGLLEPMKQRNKRFFFRNDIERISNIIRYQQAGMSLRQIKDLFDDDDGLISNNKCKFALSDLRTMLARLRVRRDEINVAIDQFESILAE